jgi:hypothetical protein
MLSRSNNMHVLGRTAVYPMSTYSLNCSYAAKSCSGLFSNLNGKTRIRDMSSIGYSKLTFRHRENPKKMYELGKIKMMICSFDVGAEGK